MKLRSITTFAIVALAAVLWAMPNNSAIADGGNDQNDQSWSAYGFGFGVSMEAGYDESTNRNGTVDQKLEVSVDHAPANATLTVTLNGVKIGTMLTNRQGEGKFQITKYGVKAGNDGRPTGARIETGDAIAVSNGSASVGGTFQKDSGNGDGNGDGNDDGDNDGDGGGDNDGDGH